MVKVVYKKYNIINNYEGVFGEVESVENFKIKEGMIVMKMFYNITLHNFKGSLIASGNSLIGLAVNT